MKEVVVLSGKGGTGKTSIVASFAALAKDAVLVDCDVDAADMHLILKPEIEIKERPAKKEEKRIKEKVVEKEEKKPEIKGKEEIIEEVKEKKKGFFEKIKDVITTKAISAEKFNELFWDLELALLENNVAVEVIEKIKKDLKEELVDKPLKRGKVEETIEEALKKILFL